MKRHGLVAKDEASRYVAGQTRSWVKIKIRHEDRFAVVGLDVPLAGACSLLLAMRQGRRLVYVGRVEWGVTRAVIAAIREHVGTRPTAGCDGAEGGRTVVWLDRPAVATVTFSELMQGRLRDPVLRGVSWGRP